MKSRTRNPVDVVDVWLREIGDLSTRSFSLRRRASENLVLRLDSYAKLDGHVGSVEFITFSESGEILLSASNDSKILLWKWENGQQKFSFDSEHEGGYIGAKFTHYSNDRSIVTCADRGMVRHAQILECGNVKTTNLYEHEGLMSVAVEPRSPHIFYTCGIDGVVNRFDLRTKFEAEVFSCQLTGERRRCFRAMPLSSLAIDPTNTNLIAVGGYDEFARVYDVRRSGQPTNFFCPPHLICDGQLWLQDLAFSNRSELLVAYPYEFIYLFALDAGLGPNPVQASEWPTDDAQSRVSSSAMDVHNTIAQVFKGDKCVKTMAFFGPNCEYVVSGSDCGRIFIWKTNTGELVRVVKASETGINCIGSHPHEIVLASSQRDCDIKLWTSKATENAKLPEIRQVERVRSTLCRWFVVEEGQDYDERDDD